MLRLPLSASKSAELKFGSLIVRHAGGGGRPGARPTFDWKEKKILAIRPPGQKRSPKAKNFGDFKNLEPYFDPLRGDRIIEETLAEEWEEPPNLLPKKNDKKKVIIKSLFGSNKAYGLLNRRPTDICRKYAKFSKRFDPEYGKFTKPWKKMNQSS